MTVAVLKRAPTITVLVCAALAAACGSGSGTPASADVWATVDGREVSREFVEKAYRRVAKTDPAPSEEETWTMKLSLLNELIVQDILVARASASNVQVTDDELNKAYNDRKQNITEEAFQSELVKRGLTSTDIRDGLRKELLAAKLLERDVASKVTITEDEIAAFYNANKAQFNVAEPAYRVAQIIVTPGKDPQIANRRGDDATSPDAAVKKIQMLLERMRDGMDFSTLAQEYSEDPQTAPQGGDLGFIPLSQLQKAPPLLRDAVLKATPGSVQHITSGGDHSLVLLVSREAAGQRDLSMPSVKDGITNNLRARKQQLLQTAYLTAARADAAVVNHLARRLVETQGKMPSLALSAPGK